MIVVVSKFTEGAWIPAVVIPLIVLLFRAIKRHYTKVGQRTQDRRRVPSRRKRTNTVVVLVGGVHRHDRGARVRQVARGRITWWRVHITTDEEDGETFAKKWAVFEPRRRPRGRRLALPQPARHGRCGYIDEVEQRWDDDRITVVIPEFVVHRWWEHLLHNQAALFLKGALLFENVAVVASPTKSPDHTRCQTPSVSDTKLKQRRSRDSRRSRTR